MTDCQLEIILSSHKNPPQQAEQGWEESEGKRGHLIISRENNNYNIYLNTKDVLRLAQKVILSIMRAREDAQVQQPGKISNLGNFWLKALEMEKSCDLEQSCLI